MKALYLDGRDGLDVGLDGPALRVHRRGRADGQFPLPRVGRIVTIGTVRWHPDALKACLRENKPVAVLDRQGRFVRVLFRASAVRYGLARHVGELLEIPRFRARYEDWFGAAEKVEMMDAVRQLAVYCGTRRPDRAWQIICFEQYRRRHMRVGACYRYLLGLAAAQIASVYLQIGLPHDPQSWGRQEYRLMLDMVRLERWRQILLLEQLIERLGANPGRRDLTAAFESASGERELRIEAWRRCALFAMMGIRIDMEIAGSADPDLQRQSYKFFAGLRRLRRATGLRTVFGFPEPFQRGAQGLRDYAQCSRGMA